MNLSVNTCPDTLLRAATARIERTDAEQLLMHALGHDRAWLIMHATDVLAEADGTGHAANFAPVVLPHGAVRGEIVTIVPTRIGEGLLA